MRFHDAPFSKFLCLAVALALIAPALLADRFSGKLTLDGKEFPLTQATAVRLPSSFVGGSLVTRIALSDVAVTHEQLRAPLGLNDVKQQGAVHAITLEFSDDRSYTTLNVVSSDHDTNLSLSGTLDDLHLETHTEQLVAGSLEMEERTMGNLRFAIALEFAVDPQQSPVVKQGPLKLGADAQKLDSVKAYLAMRKAIAAADLEAIQKLARFPEDFEGDEGLQFVKMMQEEEPTGIEVVEASEGEATATLTITGKAGDTLIRRTFEMQKTDGRWTTNNDNWQAN